MMTQKAIVQNTAEENKNLGIDRLCFAYSRKKVFCRIFQQECEELCRDAGGSLREEAFREWYKREGRPFIGALREADVPRGQEAAVMALCSRLELRIREAREIGGRDALMSVLRSVPAEAGPLAPKFH